MQGNVRANNVLIRNFYFGACDEIISGNRELNKVRDELSFIDCVYGACDLNGDMSKAPIIYTNARFTGTPSASPGTRTVGAIRLGEILAGANGDIVRTFGTAMPTLGHYAEGDYVENSSGASGQPMGWRRLTTGTSHVLGVDWRPAANYP
ncbi:hypothetical protein [Sphingomonas sp.]|uniref:hypothetical protein n=1 Tax=Sphingomonas sp. TaxID=28214 RepID=UPI001D786FF9|nr:hypothetical protein [Sphingomonas sp.]MBX9796635.1 hypothetical protein [Sphingomonas sp.]